MNDGENPVLQLLREFRSGSDDLKTRRARLERRLDEMNSEIQRSLSVSDQHCAIVVKSDPGFEQLTNKIAARKRRAQNVEARQ